MSLDKLRELVAAAAKATPGPWVNEGYYKKEPLISAPNRSVAVCCKDETYKALNDAAFICVARNAIPDLESLLSRHEALKAAMRGIPARIALVAVALNRTEPDGASVLAELARELEALAEDKSERD